MTIYVILVTILLFASIFKFNKHVYWALFFLLLLIGGLRGLSVGVDTSGYQDLFIGYTSRYMGLEYGWILLNMFVQFFFNNFQIVVFISMVLVLCPIFYVSRRMSINPILSIALFCLLYFYFNSFNITRQAIAGSFILMALYSLYNGNKHGYFIYVVLATLFHTTAILFFGIYFLYRINISKRTLMIIIVLSYLIGALNLPLIFLRNINLGEHYTVYVDVMLTDMSFSPTRLLLNIGLLCIIIWGNHLDLFVKNFILGVFVLNVFSFSPDIARFAQYFLLSQIIIIPNMELPYAPRYQDVGRILGLVYAVATFFFLISNNIAGVVPYKLCF